MQISPIGRLLWMAVHNAVFRRTAMADLGVALAEAAILLTDREMAELRSFWETVTPLSDRPALEAIQRYARLHFTPLLENEPDTPRPAASAPAAYTAPPLPTLDSPTLAALKTAHAEGDKAAFQQIVDAHSLLRPPKEMASYALIEVRNGTKGKSGWCELGSCPQTSDARQRIRIEVDGLYRLISVKRSLFIRRTAQGADVYPLPARKLVLERWAGEPTVERPDTDWLRVGFPADFAQRRGMVYATLAGELGVMEGVDDAETFLQSLRQTGTYRIIVLCKIYRRRTSRAGKVTISAHTCLVPDDGQYPELEPRVLFPEPLFV